MAAGVLAPARDLGNLTPRSVSVATSLDCGQVVKTRNAGSDTVIP